MHIPDGMLAGKICPVTAVFSVVGLAMTVWAGLRAKERPSAGRFGAVAALVFAVQMMNFPIRDGTSGHLLGGVLATAMLGTPFGVLAIALVVTIQSLLFSDGGLLVLGANVFNMAIIGAGLGGWLRQTLLNRNVGFLATATAAWVSVICAALAVSIELAVDGQIAFAKVAPAMLGTHALIGIGEAVITLAVVNVFAVQSLVNRDWARITMPLAAAGIVALLLSPFASSFPDGLEWVAKQYGFLHEAMPAFAAPLPDYAVPGIANGFLSTGLAGLIGVAVTFLAATAIAYAWAGAIKKA